MKLLSRFTDAMTDLGQGPGERERRKRETEERVARVENTFSGVLLKDGRIDSPQGGGSIAGARATVEAAGQRTRRILRKDLDQRELYLLIEGKGWGISLPVDPRQGAKARGFAAKINAAASAQPSGE
jgi:hypothetical protein